MLTRLFFCENNLKNKMNSKTIIIGMAIYTARTMVSPLL